MPKETNNEEVDLLSLDKSLEIENKNLQRAMLKKIDDKN
jgi:hypothetical protein